MRFFTSIQELAGHGLKTGLPCYCERLIYPDDLLLQSELTWQGPGPYTMKIELYAVDGSVNYGDVTDKFSYYFFKNPVTGKHSFNIRLEHFHELMCSLSCWILKVTVTDSTYTYFEKITDRYCQTSCCDTPRGVGFSQPLVIWPDDGGGGPIDITPEEAPKVDECGNTYITLVTRFDCYDNQTGDYYGQPGEGDIINGNYTGFRFERKTNLKGRVTQVSREILRSYSRNCRLTKVESARQYAVDVDELFPVWKQVEITDMLHAPYIFIDGRRYEYDGGDPFEEVIIPGDCNYLFRTNNLTLRDCEVRQTFGCGDRCDPAAGATMAMVISSGAKVFYDEDRQLIGDKDDLIDWYRNQPGMTELELLDPGDFDCSFEVGFVVRGTGYIPTSVYVDGTTIGDRVYGMSEAALADLCTKIEVPCGTPVAGLITVADDSCSTPTLGLITIVDMPVTTIEFTPLNDWTDLGNTEVVRSENTIRMRLDLFNSNYPNDPMLGSAWQWGQLSLTGPIVADDRLKNSISPIIYVNNQSLDWEADGVIHDEVAGTLDFTAIGGPSGTLAFQYVDSSGSTTPGFGMLIGMLDVWGRPNVDVYANGITVNTLGYVYYSGSPTSSDSSGSYIDTAIIYNL